MENERESFADKLRRQLGGFPREILDFIRSDAQGRIDEADSVGYDEGIAEGLHRASMAMIEAKVPEEKMHVLLAKHWDLPPSEVKYVSNKARQRLERQTEIAKKLKGKTISHRIVPREEQDYE